MLLESQIPDEKILRDKVKTAIDRSLPVIVAKTSDSYNEFVRNRKFTIWSLLGFIALTVFVLKTNYISWPVATVPLIILLISLNYYAVIWFKARTKMTIELNSILITLLTDIFGQPFSWQASGTHEMETREHFKKSGLMVESVDLLQVDDLYACNIPHPTSFRELLAVKRERDGKHDRTITLFHGLYIIVNLPKTLQAETYISTESDSSGFAHTSFWGKIIGQNKIEETKLEWNDFENNLHVSSSDGVEARYILTTNFMEGLYNWWKEGRENMRIKFSDQRMQMLLPDDRVKITFSIDSLDPKELEDYFFSMAKPLWRTLTLVEKLKL